MWTQPVQDVFMQYRLKRPLNPRGKFFVESLCSGTGAEVMAMEALGVPAVVTSFCDKKKLAQNQRPPPLPV